MLLMITDLPGVTLYHFMLCFNISSLSWGWGTESALCVGNKGTDENARKLQQVWGQVTAAAS